MKCYKIFSVGDFNPATARGNARAKLANFAALQSGGGGQKFYSSKSKSQMGPPAPKEIFGPPRSAGIRPQMGPPAPKEIFGPPRSAGIRPQMGPPAPKEIFGPPRSAAPVKKGIRKAHIRNVKGKVQMVGQSIMKAGKATAGALKANPGKAGAIGAGVVAVGGGATYLLNRKKKQRI